MRQCASRYNNQNSLGFNLIEAAIVLAVVGLVIGGIWVSAAAVQAKMKFTNTLNGIIESKLNIQSLLPASMIYKITSYHDITQELADANVFPKDWVDSSGNVTNPYGGSVVVWNIWSLPTVPRFDMAINGVPKGDCVQLVFRLGALANEANGGLNPTSVDDQLKRVGIGYLNVNGDSDWKTLVFPISMADAQTACDLPSNDILICFGAMRTN